MIYIGKDMNGTIISIIRSKIDESANAYWQGKGIIPHTIVKLGENSNEDIDNESMGYVTPILETKFVQGGFINQEKSYTVVVNNSI